MTLSPQAASASGASVTFAFSSGSPSVASVASSGLVTAVSAGTAVITVTGSGSGSGLTTTTRTATATVTVTAPPPAITAVSPSSGPSSGGTAITIAGSGFQAGATVTVGGANAASVVVSPSGTSITATTPAGAAGTTSVVVFNPDARAATLPNAFTYVGAPVVSSVTPNSGSPAGGNTVTITGTGFAAVPTVMFGNAAATNVAFSGSTSLIATVPANASGPVTVTVTNPDQQSGALANGYTYVTPAPVVTGVSPNSGGTAGGTTVFISGTGFAAGAAVSFGGTPAAGVVVSSATSITAVTPAKAAGAVAVTVTNADFQTGSLPNGFTYIAPPPPPTIGNVTPNTGSTAGGTTVTITGAGFVAGAVVSFGGTVATTSFQSATSLTAVTPASLAGTVSVSVRNPDFQSATAANAFTFVAPAVAPTVTAVSANSGSTAGGLTVTITGTNFVAGASVTFGGTPASAVAVVNPTTITAVTPARAAGAVTVTVTNPSFLAGSLANGFTYIAPSTTPVVSSVSPNSGSTSGGTSVTISGINFAAGATVTFGGAPATNVFVVSSTSITATTPAAAAGPVTVRVTNPTTEFGSLSNGFTYVAPTTLNKNSWIIDLTYLGGSYRIEAEFSQSGDSVSGNSRDNNEERDIMTSGTITGNTFTATFVMSNGGSARGQFTCTGTIGGSPQRITGTFTSPNGTFLGGPAGALNGSCVIR